MADDSKANQLINDHRTLPNTKKVLKHYKKSNKTEDRDNKCVEPKLVNKIEFIIVIIRFFLG